jgi:hypothetical protein
VCQITPFKGIGEGFVTMAAVLKHAPPTPAPDAPKISLKSEDARIQFFSPITLEWPGEEHKIQGLRETYSENTMGSRLILAPNTSWSFKIVGGPKPWADIA